MREINGVSGTFNDSSIFDYLTKNQTTTPGRGQEYLQQFVKSLAACCIISYVLGLGDRHNDNILLTRDGRLFHVDFGNCFGRVKKWGNFSRDRTPFLLTGEMYYIIKKLDPVFGFDKFIDLCQRAFCVLRKESGLLLAVVKSNVFRPGLHDVNNMRINNFHQSQSGFDDNDETTSTNNFQDAYASTTTSVNSFLTSRLQLSKTEPEANEIFESLIMSALNDNFTRINFLIHSINQAWAISSAGLKNGNGGIDLSRENEMIFENVSCGGSIRNGEDKRNSSTNTSTGAHDSNSQKFSTPPENKNGNNEKEVQKHEKSLPKRRHTTSDESTILENKSADGAVDKITTGRIIKLPDCIGMWVTKS